MIILTVLGHPDKNSFNHAIADTCRLRLIEKGHTVILQGLNMEESDPIAPTAEIPKNSPLPELKKRHCDDPVNSDGVIIVHPNWWGQPPA